MSQPTGTAPPSTPAMLHKVAFASSIGSMVEWYDFFIYGTAAALVFNKLFFPGLNRWWVHSLRSAPTQRASWHVPSAAWCSVSSATARAVKPNW